MKAPFPWFGGKRRVADVVWHAFGADVPNYIEPFAGSLAVLLGRPNGPGKIETVNDVDRYLSNFWRAVAAEPLEVARWADWPVNEADLHARHLWLVNQAEFRKRMHTDPNFYDAKAAGYWVWGICQWIGGGWCSDHAATWRPRPHLDVSNGGVGMGILSESARNAHHRKLPKLSDMGADVGRQVSNNAYSPGRRPSIGNTGQGVHLPALGNDRGVAAPPCLDWFSELQARLRRVRVACGDFARVLGPSVLGKGKNVGGRRPCAVFLDPPYSHDLRDPYLYSQDDASVAARARAWALENGDDPDLRVALCGYAGEHEMPATWTEHAWKGAGGYAREDNQNRALERIWFSPHCLPIVAQRDLFSSIGGAS